MDGYVVAVWHRFISICQLATTGISWFDDQVLVVAREPWDDDYTTAQGKLQMRGTITRSGLIAHVFDVVQL
jgi:hypothetical protein